MVCRLEMFYLNTIEQLFLFVEQLDQLEVCLPYSRLLTGIQILLVFQNLRWNSNKTTLTHEKEGAKFYIHIHTSAKIGLNRVENCCIRVKLVAITKM